MSDCAPRSLGPVLFATKKLLALGAPYRGEEIAVVMAVVSRGLAQQPNSDDECCFVSDEWISKHTRMSTHTVKRHLTTHCQRDEPVIGRSWPGRTFGTDGRWHLHDSARYTLLRTSAQIEEARRLEREHQQVEARRTAKRLETKRAKKAAEFRQHLEHEIHHHGARRRSAAPVAS